ncbi:hypothetical protein CYYG_00022 [Cyanophage SS120-1]|uniref:Uncharacterized protein n=1 Tax=Cyanophage SS120-1 TaxID=616674 RepID=M1TVS4_9CAUD|nr:hypothetical protein CYYG_00022 [Cyanophage SS120-1]AGG54524.1 hypothetical protein CYYG_00022 [Cyanophage SS120-1]
MKKWLLLLLLVTPTVVRANTITPQFTQGSMQSTTTTTQTIDESIVHDIKGGDYYHWSGNNVTPSGAIRDSNTTFSVDTGATEWQLEIVERSAGTIETITIDRDITTNATTSSYSVFSQ